MPSTSAKVKDMQGLQREDPDDHMVLCLQAFLNLGWGLGNILGECRSPSFLEAAGGFEAAQIAVGLSSRILWNVCSTAERKCKLATQKRVTGAVKCWNVC